LKKTNGQSSPLKNDWKDKRQRKKKEVLGTSVHSKRANRGTPKTFKGQWKINRKEVPKEIGRNKKAVHTKEFMKRKANVEDPTDPGYGLKGGRTGKGRLSGKEVR